MIWLLLQLEFHSRAYLISVSWGSTVLYKNSEFKSWILENEKLCQNMVEYCNRIFSYSRTLLKWSVFTFTSYWSIINSTLSILYLFSWLINVLLKHLYVWTVFTSPLCLVSIAVPGILYYYINWGIMSKLSQISSMSSFVNSFRLLCWVEK